MTKQRLTLESFTQRGIQKYGNTQGYHKVELIKGTEKVCIYCTIHEEYYFQTPYNHLQKQGCRKCRREAISASKFLTQETVIKRAIEIHGNKYGYERAIYLGNKEKMEIYCNIHKEYFWQSPLVHINIGCGCPKCGDNISSIKQRTSEEEYIRRCIEIHGNKYGYDRILYLGSDKKIEIYCNFHKEYFWQEAGVHLYQKCGCPKCGLESTLSVTRYTKEEVVAEFIKIHGERYGYEKVVYISFHEKVEIYCKVHKKYFWQSPANHINGKQGCPICSESKGERMVLKFLDTHNIKCVREYNIPGTGKYRFDFYLSEYNIFIEFHGIQHYQFVKHFHRTQETFLKRLNDDCVKKELAKAWKIKLITIKYTADSQDKVNNVLRYKLGINGVKV